MAVIVYNNGILEEFSAKNKVFTEEELIEKFDASIHLESARLIEIPNTWCLWGIPNEINAIEFNRVGSEAIDEDIYSHIIFIHDSEINPDWRATDDIIYKPYDKFLGDISNLITEISIAISNEDNENAPSEKPENSIMLITMGSTEDKRVLFSFDPTNQNENFYNAEGWNVFSLKIYDYLQENFEKNLKTESSVEGEKYLTIYSDTKTAVIIKDNHIDEVITKMIDHFGFKENYEACSYMKDIKTKWHKSKNSDTLLDIIDPYDPYDPYIPKPKKRRGRPPKNKNNDENNKKAD